MYWLHLKCEDLQIFFQFYIKVNWFSLKLALLARQKTNVLPISQLLYHKIKAREKIIKIDRVSFKTLLKLNHLH